MLGTDPHAFAAENAPARVQFNKRAPGVSRLMLFFTPEASLGFSVFKDHVLNGALPCFVAYGTVKGMMNQHEFENGLTYLFHPRGLGLDDHTL